MAHMIQIKNLNHPNLPEGIRALKNKILWKSMKDTVHCLNVVESALQQLKVARESFKDLHEQYLVKGENGPVLGKDGSFELTDKKAFEEKFKELLEVEVPIMGRMDMAQVTESKLTAEELDAVRFLFHA